MKEKLGFVGTGIMGKPMVKNLLKAGYPTLCFDIVPEPLKELAGAGATVAASSREVAEQSDVVITMLPNSPHVEQAVLGPQGILEGARPGLILLEMSTISPIVSQKVEAEAGKRGVKMLDAPVSGGEKGAIAGTLSIMVGGERAVFDQVLPIFQAMGKTITYIGPIGSGGFVKLANQIIVAINLTAIAEALVLGTKAGIDPELMINALSGGLAGSKCLDQKRDNYLQHAFQPGFKVDLHYKDLGLIMEAGRALGVPLPTTALVQELFSALRVKGRGQLDHSSIITLLEELAGVQVGGAR
jgi:2-hydroxy-3-oxopropionate reductase